MESNRIEKLLEKYWSCESTLEEEQELKNWFSSQNKTESFTEAHTLFRYFDLAKKKELNIGRDGLTDDDIIRGLNKISMESHSVEPKIAKSIKMVPNWGMIGKIAAGVVIALAATLMTLRPDLITGEDPSKNRAVIKDTFETPEEAYAETMKALALISEKMNMGRKQTAKISVYNEAEEAIKEEIIN